MRIRTSVPPALLVVVALGLVALMLLPAGGAPPAASLRVATAVAPLRASSLLSPSSASPSSTSGPAPVPASPPPLTWTNLTPVLTTSPDGRAFATMTYDATHNYGLLYSGVAEHPDGYDYLADDVWSFTPTGGWANITPVTGPGPGGRIGGMMAYDSIDSQTLLYGGCDSFACPAPYIFTYNGGGAFSINGVAQNAPGQPGALMWGGLADAPNGGGPSGGGALLFGGCNSFSTTNFRCNTGGIVGKTFLVNYPNGAALGNQPTWTPVPGPIAPSARELMGMTWDPAMHAVILYGGYDGTRLLNDTWAFSHGTWTNLTRTVGAAPYDAGGALVYDNSSGLLLLEGGLTYTGMPGNFTWALRPGGQWTNVTSRTGTPTATLAPSSCSFPGPAFPVVFSGSNRTGGFTPNTWIFGPRLVPHPSVVPAATDLGMNMAFSGWGSGGLAPRTPQWDLGDGTLLTTAYGNHTYGAVGTYTAFFNETDTYGISASSTVTVTVDPLPTVTAEAAPLVTNTSGPVAFWGNTSYGTGPFTYSWDLGDGTSSTLADPGPHTYAFPGTYQANVSVFDAVGGFAHASVNVTVLSSPIVLRAGVSPAQGAAPLAVAFQATASGGAGSLLLTWRFGDGTESSLYAAPSHTYNTTGWYNATVWANDSLGASASASVAVQVYAPLVASVHLSANGTLAWVPVTVSATTTGGLGSMSYAWSLNGSSYPTVSGPSFPYTPSGPGLYVFSVSVSDAFGDTAVARTVLEVVAHLAPLSVSVVANRTSPFQAGGTVIVNASVTGGTAPYTYLWSLNGTNRSSLASGPELVFVPVHPGFYNFTVWAADAGGQVARSPLLTVHAVAPPASSNGGGPPGGGGGGGGNNPPPSNSLTSALTSNGLWLYLLLAIVVAALLLAALYVRRRSHASASPAMSVAAGAGAGAELEPGTGVPEEPEPAATPNEWEEGAATVSGATSASGGGADGDTVALENPVDAHGEAASSASEDGDVLIEEGDNAPEAAAAPPASEPWAEDGEAPTTPGAEAPDAAEPAASEETPSGPSPSEPSAPPENVAPESAETTTPSAPADAPAEAPAPAAAPTPVPTPASAPSPEAQPVAAPSPSAKGAGAGSDAAPPKKKMRLKKSRDGKA